MYKPLLFVSLAILLLLPPMSVTEHNRLGDPPHLAALLQAYRSLTPIVEPTWQDITAGQWQWALGEPSEGLNVPLSRKPTRLDPVILPHRVLHPDTPYWYETTRTLPGPSVLRVSADDGAQLWAEGRRIPATEGSHFWIDASPSRPVVLTLRVLNKAVYGGLNRVWVTDATAYRVWQEKTHHWERLNQLVQKVQRLESPKPEIVTALQNVVSDFKQGKNTEAALKKAEAQFANYPQTRFGPILQDATADKITLMWETDVLCRPRLEWREGYSQWQTVKVETIEQENGARHLVRLTNLKPDTGYGYRFSNKDGDSVNTGHPQFVGTCLWNSPSEANHLRWTTHTFRTLPATGSETPFVFTVWADSQMGWPTFRQNVAGMVSFAPEAAFTVGVGDLVENAFQVQPWQEFFTILTPLASETPAFLVPGNHDYDGCFEDLSPVYLKRYLHATPQPEFFAWTAGNARFVALDPNAYFPTAIPEASPAYRWLRKELDSPEWKSARWHFLFMHQPPYAQGWAEYHGDDALRRMLEPLYEKYGIDFVVSGHAHDYERLTKQFGGQTVHFVIVGGAGGGLEDEAMSDYPKMDKVIRRHHFGVFRVTTEAVQFQAVATDLRLLDQFTAVK